MKCGIAIQGNIIWQFFHNKVLTCGFPGSSTGKESTCNAGDRGSIPVSGRSPGEGTG